MKTARFAQAVLKSKTSPPSFLLPALSNLSLASSSTTGAFQTPQCQSQIRKITTTAAWRAATKGPSGNGSGEETTTPEQENAAPQPEGSAQAAAVQPHTRNDISNALGDLFSETRTSRKSSRYGRGDISAIDAHQGMLARSMGLRYIEDGLGSSVWSRSFDSVPPPPDPVRLNPYIGRVEKVERGRNLAAAMRALEMKLAANKVRTEFHNQKFHERPGLKRKRLKRQRWRKRFKEGFRATVQKVVRMRNMGW